MNLNELRNANFTKLDTAVTKWDEMIGKLESVAGDMRGNVKSKADKANWKGVNAQVSRDFIRRTTTEFDEMERQAKSIRNILRDTAGELKGYQKAVNERIEAEKDLHVTDLGGGRFQVEVRDGAPEGTDPEALRSFIQTQLSAATTSDKTTADVLNSMMKLDEKGFSDVGYADRDAATAALKAAQRAAELAQMNPEDMSLAQFDQLVHLTAQHKNDPLYAERFATDLGPKKALEFWSGIGGSDISRERRDELAGFQKNLGTTLGTATRSDSTAMTRWKWDMVDLGDDRIGQPHTYYGFQVMSNLMREGDFDDSFLDSYGSRLMQMEKELTQNGSLGPQRWTMGHHMGPDMNFMAGMEGGKPLEPDNGLDPFTGFMKALSNSPDASTDFFSDSFLTKDEDHEFTNDEGNKRALSNFDYLFEEREWIQSMTPDGKSSENSYNALGEALESAMTGHANGTPPSAGTFPHSEDQAALFENMVKAVGAEPARLAEHSVMSDSMGRISAEYMPDISSALRIGEKYEKDLFPVAGALSTPPVKDVTRFLHIVGRDPEGFAAVTAGQHNYTNVLMEYHFQNPSAYAADSRFSDIENLKITATEVAANAGAIQGVLGAGRTFEVAELQATEDEEFNKALGAAKDWVSGLVSAGAAVATAGSGPGAVGAGAAAGTVTDQVLGVVTSGLHRDHSAEMIYRNGESWTAYHADTVTLVQEGAESGGRLSGNPSRHIEIAVQGATADGFGYAQDRVREYVEGHGVPSDEMEPS